ncbi:uncharacterized protein [Physcomitrium patens]|uniref:uncharacterized protein isoform X2 n=1 Tax=Physcomitrium patens TaxID=3218 RepID=UPI000D154B1F|nr:uncharacterized protein LOC112279695 isoform X2 [Physcomitrium patens]|eukprot:XP_024370140.1 uncharacterized protein LOC112279695 isoform X2 [Physcomitrella patens]
MGCGASKDGVAEPQPMQIRGYDTEFRLKGEDALKSNIQVISDINSACVSSLSISSSVLNNPPSAFFYMDNFDEDTFSDEEDSDLDPSFTLPFKRIIEEVDDDAFITTALTALSGGKEAKTDKKDKTNIDDVEKRIEVNVVAHNEVLSAESGEDYLTCPLYMVPRATSFQALMSTSPVLTQQHLGGDIMAREETDTEELLVPERTHTVHEDRRDQLEEPEEFKRPANPAVPDHEMNHFGEDSASALIENLKQEHHQKQVQPKQENLKPNNKMNTNETSSDNQDKIVPKMPPLTMVSPIPELPAHLSKKAALPTVTLKGNVPIIHQDELVTAQGPVDSATRPCSCGDNLELSRWSPMTENLEETPTPATKSPAGSEWRSPSREMLDPDIEDIVLLESPPPPPELHTLPLPAMLDCHGIHMDNRDFISPCLRFIS